jgi:hypothetical protein
MTESTTTLSQMLELNSSKTRERLDSEDFNTKLNANAQMKIAAPWTKRVKDKIAERLMELFDRKPTDICRDAWKEHPDVQQFKEQPESKPFEIELADHDIVATFKPTLDVTIAKAPFVHIELDLDLTLTLHGIHLTFQNGSISKVSIGEFDGEAELKWKELTLLKASTDTYSISDEILTRIKKKPPRAQSGHADTGPSVRPS